jgi:threonine dehydrogenase-like Zn-dependent dehydrogenase
MGSAINRGLTFRMAQTPVQRYLPKLPQHIVNGDIDPSFVITHRAALEDGPALYKMFRDKKDGCIKVVLRPAEGAGQATARSAANEPVAGD